MSNALSSRDSIMHKDCGFISASYASKKLGVHVTTLYRWIDSGKLEGCRIGGRRFVKHEALKEYIGQDISKAIGL